MMRLEAKKKGMLVSLCSLVLAMCIAALLWGGGVRAVAAASDIRSLAWAAEQGVWTDGTGEDATRTGDAIASADKMGTYTLTPLSGITGRDTRSDYAVSVDMRFAQTASSGRAEAGLIPLYVDENNFVSVNVTQEGGKVKIVSYGKLTGVENFMGGQPEDVSGELSVDVSGSFTFTVRVEKVYQESTPASRLYYYINGTQVHARGWGAAVWRLPYDRPVSVGLAARNATVTFSNLKAEDYALSSDWRSVHQDIVDDAGMWNTADPAKLLVNTGASTDRTLSAVKKQDVAALSGNTGYSASVTITPATARALKADGNHIITGIVPWFIDLDNTVSVLIWYDQTAGTTKLVTTGHVEGTAIAGTEKMLDEKFALMKKEGGNLVPGDAHTIRCAVTASKITVLMDGEEQLSFTAPDGKKFNIHETDFLATGVRAQQIEAAFSDFAFTAQGDIFTEQTVSHGGVDWKINGKLGSEWTLSANDAASLSVNYNEDNDNTPRILGTYALRPTTLSDIVGVTMSVRIEVGDYTASGNNKIGFYPFYQDANNYVFVNLSQWGDRPKANFSVVGMLNGKNIGGGNNFIEQATEDIVNRSIRTAGSFYFGADFYADRVEFRIGNTREELDTVLASYPFVNGLDVSALDPNAVTYIGYGGNSVTASFSEMAADSIANPTVPPYTGSELEANGVIWKVNGKNNGSEWSVADDGRVTMKAENVQDANGGLDRKIDQTHALRPTSFTKAFGIRLTTTMHITNSYDIAGNCNKIGIVPFYQNEDNYVFVKLSAWPGQSSCINVTGRIGGKDLCDNSGNPWYEGGQTGFKIREANDIKISVSVFSNELYVYVGDAATPSLTYGYQVKNGEGLVEAASFAEPADLAGVYVGYAGNLQEATFDVFTAEDASQVGNDLGDGWSAMNPFGWTTDAEAHSLSGNISGEAMAFKETEFRGGYVVSAKISMTESGIAAGSVGVLYKAGLVPFYKDARNYIAVWIQQYGNDAGARLVAKGQINGKNLDAANEGGYWEGSWYDTMKPVSQKTEFVMKCEVTARAVNVYLDGEYVASLKTQSELPFGENEQKISYGAVLENGAVTFSDFVVEDSTHIVQNTVLTVTVKTTDGELVKNALVKNGEQAFTNNNDGTYTLTVPVRSSVTITVELEGYDTATVEVESSMMYQPEVNQIMQIAKKQQTIIPEFNDETPNKLNVGALVGGIVGGAAGLALIAGGVIFYLRKRKSGKKEG